MDSRATTGSWFFSAERTAEEITSLDFIMSEDSSFISEIYKFQN